jgi:hypothetical protein
MTAMRDLERRAAGDNLGIFNLKLSLRKNKARRKARRQHPSYTPPMLC